jgi:hypothetical protein
MNKVAATAAIKQSHLFSSSTISMVQPQWKKHSKKRENNNKYDEHLKL